MAEIRQRIAEMVQVSRRRSAEFSAAEEQGAARVRLASTLGSLLLLAFLLLLAIVISRGTKRRDELYRRAYASETMWVTTLASIADGVIVTNASGQITFINSIAQELSGWSPKDAVGSRIADVLILVNETTRAEVPNPVDHALRSGKTVGLANHTTLIGKQGREFCIDDSAAPIRDTNGHILGAVLVFRDITTQRRGEDAIRRLAAIVDSSDDAIISKDLNGIITSWNKSAERLFGYTEVELVGKPITILIPADRLDEEPQILARIRSGERVDHFETIRRRKDGTLLEISLTISPIRDTTGAIKGASKIARDITARRKADADIRRANRDLEQFAYSASHDLQEPLRTVSIYSELLTQRYGDKLDGQALEFLGFIRNGATRMETLIRDLLSYTQISKLELVPENTDASEALAQALVGLQGVINESNARVTADPLPSIRMHGSHLCQVFQNLVGNALKYRSAECVPVVHIGAERQGGYFLFSVSDNGIGIDPKYSETIFDPFKRLHTGKEYEGTGLGLAICQRIVSQYNGEIWVESEVGTGSIFKFRIPS